MLRRRGDRVRDVLFLQDVAAHIAGQALVVLLDPRALVVLDVGGDDPRAFRDEEIHACPGRCRWRRP